jgi:hypothetical protein
MCPARAVPYRPRNQGTRSLPVPQRVHTKGKSAPRQPALLHNIFALNYYCKVCFSVVGSVVLSKTGRENMLSDTDAVCVDIY